MATTMTTPLATSQEIRDRGSTFVGYVYRARTAEEARAVLGRHAGTHVCEGGDSERGKDKDKGRDRNKDKDEGEDPRGPYVMGGWRCMAVKPGRTGLSGPDDFAVVDGCEDGGERWAGGRVLGVMKREGAIDAVVVVCRW